MYARKYIHVMYMVHVYCTHSMHWVVGIGRTILNFHNTNISVEIPRITASQSPTIPHYSPAYTFTLFTQHLQHY